MTVRAGKVTLRRRRDVHAARGRRHAAAGGFTLLEILLAMVITGLLVVVLYASMGVAFRAQAAGVETLAEARTGRIALETVAADLRGVLPPRGLMAGGFVGYDELNVAGRASDELHFVTTGAMLPAAEGMSDLRAVMVYVALDDDGAGRLVRQVQVNPLPSDEPQAVGQVLATRVVSLNIRYFDGYDWLDTWDSAQQADTLPAAIELTLQRLREGADTADAWTTDELVTVVHVVSPLTGTSASGRDLLNTGG